MSKSMSQIDDEQPKERRLRPEAMPDDMINRNKAEKENSLRPEAQLPKTEDATAQTCRTDLACIHHGCQRGFHRRHIVQHLVHREFNSQEPTRPNG
jgi:hypothetical protein